MTSCPDCKGELEQGYLTDYFNAYGSKPTIQAFVQGEKIQPGPDNLPLISNIKSLRPIKVYRCTKCNRIFQYTEEDIK